MRVIEVYDKDSDLRCYGKNIFATTKKYLAKFPAEYSNCLNTNLETLELIKLDKISDLASTAQYNTVENKIEYAKANSLGHEMFHVASNDMVHKVNAFESSMGMETALIEGMTEYSCMMAYDLSFPRSYQFEVFAVMMLADIPNIFRPYFIPNKNDFIKLFPNRKDIYGLLYSLNTYSDIMLDYLGTIYSDESIAIDVTEFALSVKYVIMSLINIELSVEKDPIKLNAYKEKFMDLISTDWIKFTLNTMYPEYQSFANQQINKRIKKR